jgi:hypothetical protein
MHATFKIHPAPSAIAVTHRVGDLAQLVERMLSMYKVTRSIRVVSSSRNTFFFWRRLLFAKSLALAGQSGRFQSGSTGCSLLLPFPPARRGVS